MNKKHLITLLFLTGAATAALVSGLIYHKKAKTAKKIHDNSHRELEKPISYLENSQKKEEEEKEKKEELEEDFFEEVNDFPEPGELFLDQNDITTLSEETYHPEPNYAQVELFFDQKMRAFIEQDASVPLSFPEICDCIGAEYASLIAKEFLDCEQADSCTKILRNERYQSDYIITLRL